MSTTRKPPSQFPSDQNTSASGNGQASTDDNEPPNGSPITQAEPDLLQDAEDWRWVVINPADKATLSVLGRWGLNVACRTDSDIRQFCEGQRVIVIAPAIKTPDREQAIQTADLLRNFAHRLVLYTVSGLGTPRTPDLLTVNRLYTTQDGRGGVLEQFETDPPWLCPEYEPAAVPSKTVNGNGKHGGGLITGPPLIDYATLSAAELNVQEASQIKAKPIKWIWKYRLAQGEMAVVAGEGGLGKSQVILFMAAAISNGSPWPDGNGDAPKGSVVVVTAEDAADDTIIPRLMVLGANLDAIKIITAPRIMINADNPDRPYIEPQSLQNLPYWRRICDLYDDLKLLVLDPFGGYLGPGISESKNDQMRSVIEPLLGIIRPKGICLLANTHLGKSLEGKSLMHRVLGSVAVVNIPRNVHVVFRHPDDAKVRIFGPCKNNNSPDTAGLQFRIKERSIDSDEGQIETSMPEFLNGLIDPHTLERFIGAERRRPGPKPVKLAEVALWLKSRLELGRPVPQRDVINDAREAGHLPSDPDGSKTALYQAAERFSEFHAGWKVVKDAAAKPQTFQLVRTEEIEPSDQRSPF